MHPFIIASIVIFAVVIPASIIIRVQMEERYEEPDKLQGIFIGAGIGVILACLVIGFLGVTCIFCY